MRTNNLVRYLIFFMSIILYASCTNDEVALEPSKITSMSRFEFPEGTNSYDTIFKTLAGEYDTKIIYKGWVAKDWNKSWTAGISSSQYVILGEHYVGVDSLQKIAEFYKKAFSYLNVELARKLLPQYIYIVRNWRYDWGAIGISYPQTKKDGLDFWLFSFPPTDYLGTDTERNIRGARCSIINLFLELAVTRGYFVEPDNFKSGIDYNTKIYNRDDYISDPNYYKTRGFVELVNTAKFTALSKPGELGTPANFYSGTGDFLAYLRIGMYYTEAEMKQNYAGFTLILSRYQTIKNYMKTKYNFDLNAIAAGN